MKGIAVSTILKFLLGLLVVVALAFLIFRIIYSPPVSENECRVRMTSWCSNCYLNGWSDETTKPRDTILKSCAHKYFGIPTDCEKCSDFEPLNGKEDCKGLCDQFLP